jgi:hypothetical protein
MLKSHSHHVSAFRNLWRTLSPVDSDTGSHVTDEAVTHVHLDQVPRNQAMLLADGAMIMVTGPA